MLSRLVRQGVRSASTWGARRPSLAPQQRHLCVQPQMLGQAVIGKVQVWNVEVCDPHPQDSDDAISLSGAHVQDPDVLVNTLQCSIEASDSGHVDAWVSEHAVPQVCQALGLRVPENAPEDPVQSSSDLQPVHHGSSSTGLVITSAHQASLQSLAAQESARFFANAGVPRAHVEEHLVRSARSEEEWACERRQDLFRRVYAQLGNDDLGQPTHTDGGDDIQDATDGSDSMQQSTGNGKYDTHASAGGVDGVGKGPSLRTAAGNPEADGDGDAMVCDVENTAACAQCVSPMLCRATRHAAEDSGVGTCLSLSTLQDLAGVPACAVEDLPSAVTTPTHGLRHGVSLMHICAQEGYTNALRTLVRAWGSLQGGCGVDARTDNGCTALHLAAAQGHLACVRALVDAGADVCARTFTWDSNVFGKDSGQTPIHWAAEHGRAHVLEYLMNRAAGLPAASDGDRAEGAGGAAAHDDENSSDYDGDVAAACDADPLGSDPAHHTTTCRTALRTTSATHASLMPSAVPSGGGESMGGPAMLCLSLLDERGTSPLDVAEHASVLSSGERLGQSDFVATTALLSAVREQQYVLLRFSLSDAHQGAVIRNGGNLLR